jgi:hypothetical protein
MDATAELPTLRKLKQLPIHKKFKIESDKRPTFAFSERLNELPNLMQHLVERALPIVAKLSVLKLLPHLSNVLIDKELAQLTKFTTESRLLIEKELRIDIEDPRHAVSITDDLK